MMTENFSGRSLSIGEVLEKISGTAVKIFGFVAGSVGLLYAIGFTVVNLDLFRHGVYEVGLVRARYISAGVSYLVLVSLLAGIVFACLYWVDLLMSRLRENHGWSNLLISFIPIFLVCYILAMWVSGFRAVSELDPMKINIPFFRWCLVFSLFLLLMMGSKRIPKVRDMRSKLEPGGMGSSMNFGERLAALGVWSIVVFVNILILYFYGKDIYETFPSALGGGQPIRVQFTGEESSLAALEKIGITQLEPGLTYELKLIAQTENNYIVLVYDSDLKTDVAVSFDKSFTKGIKYHPEERFLSPEYWMGKYTAEGSKHLEEGEFAEAVRWFDEALGLRDTYVPALQGKGEALIGLLDYDEAISLYTELIESNKEFQDEEQAPANYDLAWAYAGNKQFEEAVKALEKAFEWDETFREKAKTNEIFRANNDLLKEIFQGSQNAAIWFGQEGDRLRESGDLDGSIEMYKEAISLGREAKDPKSEANYHYRLSVVYRSKANIIEARNEIDLATNLDPDNPVYQLGLADIFVAQTEFENAINQYELVLTNNRDNLAARSGLADAYLALGNYMQAENAYQAVIEVDPSNASGYYNLARVQAKQGKNEDAILAYRSAVTLNPNLREKSQDDELFENIRTEIADLNEAAEHNSQGDQLRDAGEIDQAVSEYQKAVALDPSNDSYHANLGKAYEQQGRLADAGNEFATALSEALENDEYYSLLGEVKFKRGDLEGAIDNYAKALDLNAQNPIYHAQIAEAYSESGNLQATIDEYAIAIDLDQKNPAYLFQFARALNDYGEPGEAISHFNEVLSLDPDYSDAYCGLAIAYQNTGRIEEAKDNLAKCIELSTNDVLVKEAQKKTID